ncbi:MAG: response regulator [Oligoflexia bacterium]|nr:response regulator [Oligoflexia bacterium]
MSNVKILLVDDHESAICELVNLLKKSDYEVLEARDGLIGLEILNNNPEIKLIVTDLYMPNMDGISMCEKIRENKNYDSIVIFMATTETSPAEKERGKKFKIKAWISKPYEAQAVLNVIKKIGI